MDSIGSVLLTLSLLTIGAQQCNFHHSIRLEKKPSFKTWSLFCSENKLFSLTNPILPRWHFNGLLCLWGQLWHFEAFIIIYLIICLIMIKLLSEVVWLKSLWNFKHVREIICIWLFKMVQNIMAGYIFGPTNIYKAPANYYPIRLVSPKNFYIKNEIGKEIITNKTYSKNCVHGLWAWSFSQSDSNSRHSFVIIQFLLTWKGAYSSLFGIRGRLKWLFSCS